MLRTISVNSSMLCSPCARLSTRGRGSPRFLISTHGTNEGASQAPLRSRALSPPDRRFILRWRLQSATKYNPANGVCSAAGGAKNCPSDVPNRQNAVIITGARVFPSRPSSKGKSNASHVHAHRVVSGFCGDRPLGARLGGKPRQALLFLTFFRRFRRGTRPCGGVEFRREAR